STFFNSMVAVRYSLALIWAVARSMRSAASSQLHAARKKAIANRRIALQTSLVSRRKHMLCPRNGGCRRQGRRQPESNSEVSHDAPVEKYTLQRLRKQPGHACSTSHTRQAETRPTVGRPWRY